MTTADDVLGSIVTKKEPKRNRYGQYLLPEPSTGTEVAYQRVTTLARTMADTFALERWQVRMTAKGLALRPDLFAQVAAATLDEKALLNEVCELAQEAAGATIGRNAGSAMHRFAQRANAGEQVQPPAPFDKDLQAYLQARAAAEITTIADMSERIIVVPSISVAGQFDDLLTSPRWVKPRIGDLKTAQTMYDWLAVIIQLACYAHAEAIWDLETERYIDMPDVDQNTAIIMHAPAGSGECKLYEVDIAAGWEAAQLAVQIRGWRKRRDLAAELNPAVSVEAPDDGGLRAEHARQRLVVLAGMNAAVTWPAGVQTFKEVKLSKHIFTHDELLKIEHALSEAEKTVEAPFPPAEPPADPRRLATMIARLESMPPDLFEQAKVAAAAERVPHLRGNLVNVRHLDVLEAIVAPLEAEAAKRAHGARGLLGEYGDDAALGRLILGLAGCADLSAVTDETAVWVTAIVEALDDDILVAHVAEDGTESLVPGPKAEELIVGFGGGARAVAVKKVAELAAAHGLSRPRSVAVASSDPLLCALVAHAARVPA